MQFVTQTKFTDEALSVHGNCMAACIASLIDVNLASVPAWEDMGEDGSWGDSFIEFLEANGFSYEGLFTAIDPSLDWWAELIKRSPGVDGHFIVGGKSPRLGGRGHAVIFRDGVMVHDPHPSGEGLTSVEEVYMIERETQRPNFGASSYDAGITAYHSVEPHSGGEAKVLAKAGPIGDEEIARLTADGLVLLWRHGAYAFLARPEANEVGAKPGMAQMTEEEKEHIFELARLVRKMYVNLHSDAKGKQRLVNHLVDVANEHCEPALKILGYVMLEPEMPVLCKQCNWVGKLGDTQHQQKNRTCPQCQGEVVLDVKKYKEEATE